MAMWAVIPQNKSIVNSLCLIGRLLQIKPEMILLNFNYFSESGIPNGP